MGSEQRQTGTTPTDLYSCASSLGPGRTSHPVTSIASGSSSLLRSSATISASTFRTAPDATACYELSPGCRGGTADTRTDTVDVAHADLDYACTATAYIRTITTCHPNCPSDASGGQSTPATSTTQPTTAHCPAALAQPVSHLPAVISASPAKYISRSRPASVTFVS